MEHVSDALRKQNNSNLHAMARNSCTIEEMWNEYQHGINGCSSLRYLESKHGSKWRNDTECCGKNKWFNRVNICLEVDRLTKTGLSENEAVSSLQSLLDAFPKKGKARTQIHEVSTNC